MTSYVGVMRILSSFGSDPLAGYTIGFRILMFAMLPASGLANAAATLHEAILTVASVLEQRTKLIADTGRTVLDEWIERNRDYDIALQALYVALDQSGGTVTVKVQAARRAERAAFDQLPPDRRTIIVIIAEIARGGLTQAVLAIEDARGRLEDALAEAVPGPDQSGAPTQTEAPGGTEAPGQTLSPGESSVPLP